MKPILANFAAVQAAASDGRTKAILFLPAGRHQITPYVRGEATPIDVLVDEATAAVIENQRAVLAARGEPPFFSPSHQSATPWFNVDSFKWETRRGLDGKEHSGVWAFGRYADPSVPAKVGTVLPYFSPEFWVDNYLGRPARIIAREDARQNMGGFVDQPAFPMPPVPVQAAAGDNSAPVAAGAVADSNQPQNQNTDPMKKSWLLHNQLPADGGGGTAAAAPVQAAAAPAVSPATAAAPATPTPVQASAADLAELQRLRAEKQAGIEREADAAVAVMAANGLIAPKDEAAKADWRKSFIADPSLIERATKLPSAVPTARMVQAAGSVLVVAEDVKRVVQAYGATSSALERAQLWAADLRGRFKGEFERAIQAANSIGTLSGDLVVQQSLDNLLHQFPMLSRVVTDFSGAGAMKGQNIVTRVRGQRAASTYSEETGYAAGNASHTDVEVTIDTHIYDQVAFNANELASTRRKLFDEEEEGMHYSLGLAITDALYALITTGNYTLTPVTKSLVEFGRDSIVDMKTSLHTAKVYGGTRTLLLNSSYYGATEKDTTVINNQSNPAAAQVFAQSKLPPIAEFSPFEAGNLPTTGNLVGFGFRQDAMLLATRVPNDYTNALPGVPSTGLVQVVTQPETGLSVLVTKYVDHDLGTAKMRVAIIYGVAKARATAGVILRSAAP